MKLLPRPQLERHTQATVGRIHFGKTGRALALMMTVLGLAGFWLLPDPQVLQPKLNQATLAKCFNLD